MKKYAIELTKGDNEIILETFESKEQAMAAGEGYRKKYTREQGLLSCILADFDEENNMIGNNYRLFHSWL